MRYRRCDPKSTLVTGRWVDSRMREREKEVKEADAEKADRRRRLTQARLAKRPTPRSLNDWQNRDFFLRLPWWLTSLLPTRRWVEWSSLWSTCSGAELGFVWMLPARARIRFSQKKLAPRSEDSLLSHPSASPSSGEMTTDPTEVMTRVAGRRTRQNARPCRRVQTTSSRCQRLKVLLKILCSVEQRDPRARTLQFSTPPTKVPSLEGIREIVKVDVRACVSSFERR